MESLIQNRQIPLPRPNSTHHICVECSKEFWGRKNRVFCSKECKIKANNYKAAIKRSRVSEQTRMLEKNAQILEELCEKESYPTIIEKEQLIRKGFIETGPNIRLFTTDNKEWCQIGNYVFNVDKNTNLVAIMQINDFNKIL